jgi:hypothetical protein
VTTRRVALALAIGLATAPACGVRAPALRDVDGREVAPLAVANGDVHVVVFTSHECPIANAYAPTLQQLAATWQSRTVRLFVVHVDPDLDAAAAREHAAAFGLPGTVVLDPHHTLARALGATHTPEAAVLTTCGLAYRGRIDDQWAALGARAPAASRHDLRDAVAAVLAGQAVATPRTAAVGCLLPEPRHP